MHSVKYVHWQEGDRWLGYLEEYPDYWTQGETLQELVDHLRDLYVDLSGGHIPGARQVAGFVFETRAFAPVESADEAFFAAP